MANQSKPKYEKPRARALGSVAAAEGFCTGGGTASKTTCTLGVQTEVCSTGNTAVTHGDGTACGGTGNVPQICFPTGGFAANCFPGTIAGG